MDILDQVERYDFYHLPTYHALAQECGEGDAVLFVYQEKDKTIALPLLLRSVDSLPGLEGYTWRDATTVYGYPGPILNKPAMREQAFIMQFQQALLGYAREIGLVAVFSRLNPILENRRWLYGLGNLTSMGETVSIDLALDPGEQFASYRKGHRYDVRRARKEGLSAYLDETWSTYDHFIRLYTETMQRVGAKSHYYFDRAYFDGLRSALGDRLKLIVAEIGGEICSGALFVHTSGIVQYHLSGSHEEYLDFSPSKLVLDEARKWGNSVGASQLHLGGGVGSQKDGLFQLKAGFSTLRHQFYTWKWVVRPELYDELVQATDAVLDRRKERLPEMEFFPEYRL